MKNMIFGFSKRKAVYDFCSAYLRLNLKAIQAADGSLLDTKSITIEPETAFYVFGEEGEKNYRLMR